MKATGFVAVFLLPFCVIAAELNRNIIARGSYANSQLQFEKNKTGRVAFMGGSITQMNGYRPMVTDWLQKRYPKTKFEFINGGISSTCSTVTEQAWTSCAQGEQAVRGFDTSVNGLHHPTAQS